MNGDPVLWQETVEMSRRPRENDSQVIPRVEPLLSVRLPGCSALPAGLSRTLGRKLRKVLRSLLFPSELTASSHSSVGSAVCTEWVSSLFPAETSQKPLSWFLKIRNERFKSCSIGLKMGILETRQYQGSKFPCPSLTTWE